MPTRPQLPAPPRRGPPAAGPPLAGSPRTRGRGDPGGSRRPRGGGDPAGAQVALRLAIGRDGIGLELAEPVEMACLRVVELSTTLPGMRFPVDVSGGVTRFRHRRGDLQILRVEVAARDVEKWLAPRLRGLVGTRVPDVWIEVGRATSTVCVAALLDAEEREPSANVRGTTSRDAPVLAFDVHAMAEGEDIALVVANARGAGLPGPASAIALACVESALGAIAERAGAIFTLRRPAAVLARALLPAVGARVPSSEAVRWAALGVDGGTWVLHASRNADAAVPTEAALRAREIATLLGPGDEALMRGDLSAARTEYLAVLERAPRHAEVAARVVDIDARIPARAEAALATMVESSGRGEGAGGGIVAGELLAQVGDTDAAIASFERAGEVERAPALAARAFELAARTSRDPEAAARWLESSAGTLTAIEPGKVGAGRGSAGARADRGRRRGRRAPRGTRSRRPGKVRGMAARGAGMGGGGPPGACGRDLRARAAIRARRAERPRGARSGAARGGA